MSWNLKQKWSPSGGVYPNGIFGTQSLAAFPSLSADTAVGISIVESPNSVITGTQTDASGTVMWCLRFMKPILAG